MPTGEVVHHFTPQTSVTEPIELRLSRRGGRDQLVLVVSSKSGLLSYYLTTAGSDIPHSLSNLQAVGAWPRKAVAGWQLEVIDVARMSRAGTVEEIR